MKKYTALGDSIFTIKKPDTSWHKTLAVVVLIVALSFLILNYGIISEEVAGLIK